MLPQLRARAISACARSPSPARSCSRRRWRRAWATPQVAAHTIGFQLWIFVALVLDSVAIAAQALIGRLLGAGAVDAAAILARRLLVAGLVFGIAVGALFAAGLERRAGAFTDRIRGCAIRPPSCGPGWS